MKQLGFFIVLSLVLHFLVTTTTLYFADKYYSPPKEVTELEILGPQDSLQNRLNETKQLVKQLKATVEKIQEAKKARFESEQTQRVKEETRAVNLGLTQNALQNAVNHQTGQQEKSQEKQKSKNERGEVPEFAKFLKSSAAQVQAGGDSAVSLTLPNDIRASNATNLNTDANVYYTFYNRVEELFYVRWVERNRYYWQRIDGNYKRNVLSGKVWSTTIEVWLRENGEYHSSYILQSSGYEPFDEATIFAFKDTRLFPNPPRAKVERDGFVRLRYRFNVQVEAY